tara:strand:+ start:595 stop:1254 length:660 start_codon:yes stop_codon:yes gene_type:complete
MSQQITDIYAKYEQAIGELDPADENWRKEINERQVPFYSAFLSEFQEETDRGAALLSVSLFDEVLTKTLLVFLADEKETKELLIGSMSPLSSFAAKTKLCYSLGLLNDFEYREIDTIRKIRNEFAHKGLGLTFQNEKIIKLCRKLLSHQPGPFDLSHQGRTCFNNAVILTFFRIYYLPYTQKKHKREVEKVLTSIPWVDPISLSILPADKYPWGKESTE